ncbi:hypothetical protein [Streptomyces sp. NPDC000851]
MSRIAKVGAVALGTGAVMPSEAGLPAADADAPECPSILERRGTPHEPTPAHEYR